MWRDESVDGVKTGHTDSAGYCLVTSAEKEGMRLITVVLGTDSENARAEASQALLNYGFRFFETRKILSAGKPLRNVRIWKGDADDVAVGVARDVYMTYPRGQKDSLKAQLLLSTPLEAPVQKGQQLGSVTINLDGVKQKSVPLVSLASINEGGFFSRMTDSVMLWFE